MMVNTKNPSVSFLIATFNRANYLDLCIESILAQSEDDFEIIVVDDGSKDNTEELIKNKYGERVIYLKNQSNRGVAFSRNLSINYARGEFLGLIDSDDILSDRKYLETALKILKSDPQIDIFCCDNFCIDELGERIGDKTFLHSTIDYKGVDLTSKEMAFSDIFMGGIHSCGALVRREIINQTGPLNTNYRIMWDEEFFLRVSASNKFKIYYYDHPLTAYRIHKNNFSKNISELYRERIKARFEIIKTHGYLRKKLGIKFNQRMANQYFCLSDAYLRERNFPALFYSVLKAVFIYPPILLNFAYKFLLFPFKNRTINK